MQRRLNGLAKVSKIPGISLEDEHKGQQIGLCPILWVAIALVVPHLVGGDVNVGFLHNCISHPLYRNSANSARFRTDIAGGQMIKEGSSKHRALLAHKIHLVLLKGTFPEQLAPLALSHGDVAHYHLQSKSCSRTAASH